MRATRVFAAAVLVLLAGCSDAPQAADVPTGSMASTTTASVPVAEPTIEVVPFSFDGNLGTLVHSCIFPANLCQGAAPVEDVTDLFVDRPGANLTALSFEMTWAAKSLATQELWVGAMVMTSCEDCNDTEFPDVHGVSPLRLDVQGISVPLSEEARIHIYAYNPMGFVYDPAVPGYVVISADEPFHIEGTATFLIPPA